MTFAATWAPRVLAVAGYVAWMGIRCPAAVELFDLLFDKPKSAATSGPAATPTATAQEAQSVEEQSAKAVARYGWLAVQLLLLGLALNCARLAVGVRGYAMTVLTAPLPGTWAMAFLLVLAGSWLHKLWSNLKAAGLFDALYVLAIGLNIGRTAGFSASFLSSLPSVQLEHNSFRGLLKVPAEVASGAHAQAWYRMFSLVVNWGAKLLFVASFIFFAKAVRKWLANADSTEEVRQKGPAAIPGAAVCAAQDLIAGCKSSTDEPQFAAIQVAAATNQGQKGWRLSEGVRHWRKWQKEEQLKIYRYWELSSSVPNLGPPAMRGLLWGTFFTGCLGCNGMQLAWRPVIIVVVVFCGMFFGMVFHGGDLAANDIRCTRAGKSQLLKATSAGLNARLGLAHATSQAHALASSVDQQPNTIWEVQLVKGDHSASQKSQSGADKLSAVRLMDIERGTEHWDKLPDSARTRAIQAESALTQAQAQAEEQAGEEAQRSLSLSRSCQRS